MQTECKDCTSAEGKAHYGIYNLKCRGCRDRMVMSETCKVHREIVHKGLYRYGDLSEWKVEPHCGCTITCKRRQFKHH